RRQEVDITLWNKESAKPQTPHMALRGPSQPQKKQQLLENAFKVKEGKVKVFIQTKFPGFQLHTSSL
ncbi:54S ribosomal protein L2, mitochondrial, partial [Clarias magur]